MPEEERQDVWVTAIAVVLFDLTDHTTYEGIFILVGTKITFFNNSALCGCHYDT
jgi:hypothetical protein